MVYKSYRVADHVFGIRTNSEEAGEWLAETFAAWELTDEEADPYFSIFIADEEGMGRRYHILYKESTDVLRTFDAAKVAQRLVAEVGALALRRSDAAPVVDACAVSRNGLNVLVPTGIIPYLRLNGRRVERELTLPNEPVVGVDPRSGRLFSAAPPLDVPESAFEDFARRFGANGGEGRASSGVPASVDIVCAFHYDPDSPPILPLSRAFAVHSLAKDVINIKAVGGRALEPLAKLVRGTRCYLLQETTPEQAFELLTTVIDGDESEIAAMTSV